jgi:hypothetical protein
MAKKDTEFKPKVSVVAYYVNSISGFLDLLCGFKGGSRSFVVGWLLGAGIMYCCAASLHTDAILSNPV